MAFKNIFKRIYRFFIYEHERIGYLGKPFKMLKIRTMVLNSDELLPIIEKTHSRNKKGQIIKDPRLTKIGKFLKIHRIDEIPQWINILKGEMAIIGPRPHSKFFTERYVPENLHKIRIKVKPGWLKPKMAFADFDYGGLEFAAEEKFLKELEKNPVSTKISYSIRAISPSYFKWRLIQGGRIYKSSDYFKGR